MRTTLTLDSDVAAAIESRRRAHNHSLKEEVNELIRVGLLHVDLAPSYAPRFHVEPLNVGECLVDNVDDISTVLAVAEGEAFR